MTALLRLVGVRKSYGAVTALKGVDLDIFAGEVVAICGDNGAGKSTLIRICSGAHLPSAGTLELDGRAAHFASPRAALAAGVATIYQDLALAPRLPIWQNIFIGAELTRRLAPGLRFLDKRRMRVQAREYLARLKVDIADTDRPVELLSGGQRQAVAIARATAFDARVVIMDEPTAALAIKEVGKVLDLIKSLKEHGVSVILISHRLDDVFYVCDRVMALFRGGNFAEAALRDTNRNEVIGWIMGTKGHTAALAHDRVQ